MGLNYTSMNLTQRQIETSNEFIDIKSMNHKNQKLVGVVFGYKKVYGRFLYFENLKYVFPFHLWQNEKSKSVLILFLFVGRVTLFALCLSILFY